MRRARIGRKKPWETRIFFAFFFQWRPPCCTWPACSIGTLIWLHHFIVESGCLLYSFYREKVVDISWIVFSFRTWKINFIRQRKEVGPRLTSSMTRPCTMSVIWSWSIISLRLPKCVISAKTNKRLYFIFFCRRWGGGEESTIGGERNKWQALARRRACHLSAAIPFGYISLEFRGRGERKKILAVISSLSAF